MNCEDCQQNISLFLDGELDEVAAENMRTHLTYCQECAKLCEDFSAILDSCHDAQPGEIVPPNAEAMWRRIHNLLETEVKPDPIPPPRSGWFSSRWNLTFSQASAGVVAIALLSSLLTIVGIRNYFEPTGDDFTSRSAASQTTFEKVLSKIGLIDTPQQARDRRIKEQLAAIEYWNKRVAQRRLQWDAKIRDAFDRNLHVIDE